MFDGMRVEHGNLLGNLMTFLSNPLKVPEVESYREILENSKELKTFQNPLFNQPSYHNFHSQNQNLNPIKTDKTFLKI